MGALAQDPRRSRKSTWGEFMQSDRAHVSSGSALPVLGITMGDPAGIGPELCLRALGEPAVLKECVPLVFGDAGVLDRVARSCGFPATADVLSMAEWVSGASPGGPGIVDCQAVRADAVRPGMIDARYGRAAYTYIEMAIRAALAGRVAAVVTAPIHKEAFHLSGVPYPGHTEIFAALSGAERACMMLASEEITVSFVTTHVGLADLSQQLSVERVLAVIELTSGAMARVVERAPRIAVCGLNPHAGEHGLFGKGEEQAFIEPAIAAAQAKGIDVIGPLPPDAAFLPAVISRVDAFVAMYHDQGHIPFKMLAFDTGVNVTLGLPIIRTSVDHGTAFDIAWTGKASPNSLYAAIRWATRLASAESPSAKRASAKQA